MSSSYSSGLGCLSGPISLCVDLFVFICVFFCFILHSCIIVSMVGGPDGTEA